MIHVFFPRDHHSIATQTKNNIKAMGYKAHNTYNHGYKGDFNFTIFVMKILRAHYFQN
jgi:hypothetical protein